MSPWYERTNVIISLGTLVYNDSGGRNKMKSSNETNQIQEM